MTTFTSELPSVLLIIYNRKYFQIYLSAGGLIFYNTLYDLL